MNPFTVTESLIQMKHDAIHKLKQIVKTSKISSVGIEGIEITPCDDISNLDEEIFLSMDLSMAIDGVTMREMNELLRTGQVELRERDQPPKASLYNIMYTTSYGYDSEDGTGCEAGFAHPAA